MSLTLKQCVPTARNRGLYKQIENKISLTYLSFVTVLKKCIYAACTLLRFANFKCYDPYKSAEWQLMLNSKLFRKVKAIGFPIVILILFLLRSVKLQPVYTNKTVSLSVP